MPAPKLLLATRSKLRPLSYLLMATVMLLGHIRVYADGATLNQDDIYSITNNSPYYDPSATADCTSSGLFDTTSSNAPAASATAQSSGVWNSGLQPPYILEQFAIETLKDVAKKLNVPVANAVTQEHTIALLSFMYGEGGDINNSHEFNPLNTGIDAPDLVAGSHAGDGTQSFKSFDAGVEGTARTIVRPQYSRLAAALTNPSSTAEEFMSALTYYSKYPGNLSWAQASEPPHADSYYQERLSLVKGTRNDYNSRAGLVIGTAAKEQQTNSRDDSKIMYHPTTSSSATVNNADGSTSDDTDGSTGSCSSGAGSAGGVVANNVAQTAVNLAWPEKWSQEVEKTEPGRDGPLVPKPAYAAAITQYNPAGKSSAQGADCGAFVATVMHATGADPNYPSLGTSIQLAYVKAHPEKYDVVDSVQSTGDLQAGDIMIVAGDGGAGHTYIFVGKQANGNDIASASLGDRMPNLGKSYVSDYRGSYTRARLKQ